MQTFLFLRLSIVKHFPNAAVQTKKATLEGIFCFQGILYGIVGFGCGIIGQGIANLIMTAKRYTSFFFLISNKILLKRKKIHLGTQGVYKGEPNKN